MPMALLLLVFGPRYSIPREEKLCYAKTKYSSISINLLTMTEYCVCIGFRSTGLFSKEKTGNSDVLLTAFL